MSYDSGQANKRKLTKAEDTDSSRPRTTLLRQREQRTGLRRREELPSFTNLILTESETIDVISLYMLYVRGNNCDTDDAEYYVNNLMVAVLRELDGDTLLYYRSKPHHDGGIMTGCRRRDCLRKI